MVSDVIISNMRARGFVFNDDGIPIACPAPLSGRELPKGDPYGSFGMVFDDYELAYRHDRTLYIQYPSDNLVSPTLRYTLTYVFDLEGFPVLREDGRSIDEVINEHWMANTTWGNRLNNLRQVSDEDKRWAVRWWQDGEVVYTLTIGEIIDRFMDPDRLEAQRAYMQAKMDAMRDQTPAPLRPKEESDPPAFHEQSVDVVVPESQMVRAAPGVKLTQQSDGSILAELEDVSKPVVWDPQQANGFQHVNLNASTLPAGVKRLALEHSTPQKAHRIPDGHAVLRGWGTDLFQVVINGVTVDFEYNERRERYEATIDDKQLERLL